jgi:hypothetical protein
MEEMLTRAESKGPSWKYRSEGALATTPSFIRGLTKSVGGDQVAVLYPGRVFAACTGNPLLQRGAGEEPRGCI